MIYTYNVEGGEPRMDIGPRLKEQAEWSLQCAKYIYNQHLNSWLYNEQSKISILRRYAAGFQPIEQYKSIFFGEEEFGQDGQDNAREYVSLREARRGFTNINWEDRFSPAPNMMSTIIGMMESQEHSIQVRCIDERSQNDRQELKYKLKVMMENRELLQAVQAMFGQKGDMLIPSSTEELALYETIGGFMLPYEIGLEEIVNHAYRYDNNATEIRRRVIKDFVTLRMGGYIDKINPVTKRVEWEYLDPKDLIVQYSDDLRFNDIWYWGRQKIYTVGDVRQKSGWPEEKIREIALYWNGNTYLRNTTLREIDGVTVYYNGQIPNYNDIKVCVLEYEYKTINSEYTTRVNSPKDGSFEVSEPYRKKGYRKPKIYNKEETGGVRETIKDSYQAWYKGSWVMGTDYIYDYGRKTHQAFDFEGKEARPSLHFYVLPVEKSIIEQAKPILDNIQMIYYKYQNDIATSPPTNGLAIEVGSMKRITLGDRKLNPFDTLKIYEETGKLLYSMNRVSAPGSPEQFNNVTPFQQLPGGIGKAVADFVAGVGAAYEQLAAITGIDRYTINSATASGEISATAVKSAVSSTKDTLKPIYSGWITVLESAARNTALVGQYLCVYNEDETTGYYPVIGRAKMAAILSAGDLPPTYFGITIQAMPTEAEIAEVRMAAQAAMSGGKNGIPAITMSEYLFIVDGLKMGRSIKDIMAYIGYKERLRDMAQQQSMETNQKMNAQAAMQQEMLKKAGEIDLEKAKTDNQIKVEFFKNYFKAMAEMAVDKAWNIEQMKAQALSLGIEIGREQMPQASTTPEMGGQEGGMQEAPQETPPGMPM
jgi:hypothetical protein